MKQTKILIFILFSLLLVSFTNAQFIQLHTSDNFGATGASSISTPLGYFTPNRTIQLSSFRLLVSCSDGLFGRCEEDLYWTLRDENNTILEYTRVYKDIGDTGGTIGSEVWTGNLTLNSTILLHSGLQYRVVATITNSSGQQWGQRRNSGEAPTDAWFTAVDGGELARIKAIFNGLEAPPELTLESDLINNTILSNELQTIISYNGTAIQTSNILNCTLNINDNPYLITNSIDITQQQTFLYNWSSELQTNSLEISCLNEDTTISTGGYLYTNCLENWDLDINECLQEGKTTTYTDLNNCGTTNNLPPDNSTITSCVAIQSNALSILNLYGFILAAIGSLFLIGALAIKKEINILVPVIAALVIGIIFMTSLLSGLG